MSVNTKLVVAFAILPLSCVQTYAADCEQNFTSSGNFLSGKTFKTYAGLPNVAPDSAFQAIYRSMVNDGNNIQHVDKSARVLIAQDRNASANRPMPFTVGVEDTNPGSRVALSFSIPGGALATEGAVKGAFCELIEAAGQGQPKSATDAAPENGAGTNLEGNSRRDARASTATVDESRLCLGSACLGMTLAEAAQLDLKPLPPQTLAGRTDFRIGSYGASGIDLKGKQITFGPIDIDKKWIASFLKSVSTICSSRFLTAHTTASDGKKVTLIFSLGMTNGKAAYQLNQIIRFLPQNMSESERESLVKQLKQRYGVAFGWESRGQAGVDYAMTHPSVRIASSSIELQLPPTEISAAAMEQPGCSAKVSID